MANTEDTDKTQEETGVKDGRIRRLFAFLGICFPREKGKLILFRKRFLATLVVAFVLFVIGNIWFIHFTSSPPFCTSCHYIRPYVATWKTSPHKQFVCTNCHFGIGPRDYMMCKINGMDELIKTITGKGIPPHPHSVINNDICLQAGCHDRSKLKDGLKFEGKYNYGHTVHLTKLRNGKELRCTGCHSNNGDQKEHFKVDKDICVSCHFKGKVHDRAIEPVGACTACHGAPVGDIKVTASVTFNHKRVMDRKVDCAKCHFDSVQGDGAASLQMCRSCHGKQGVLDKFKDPKLVHKVHLTQEKLECFQCHTPIKHGLRVRTGDKPGSCSACHASGHTAMEEMFAGRGGQGIKDQPSTHSILNVDCVACHEWKEKATPAKSVLTYDASSKSCNTCHGAAMDGMVDTWKSVIGETLAEGRKGLIAAQKAFKALPAGAADAKQIAALLAEARHNCDFIEEAHGVHNPNYALSLLDKVSSDVQKARGLIKKAAAGKVTPAKSGK